LNGWERGSKRGDEHFNKGGRELLIKASHRPIAFDAEEKGIL